MIEHVLIDELCNRSCQHTAGRHLLVIQDTTSFNLNKHYHRIKKDHGIGTIEDNYSLGFFLHASMIIDAFSGSMLGFSDVQIWNRKYDDPQRAQRIRKLPIEEKESYKWIKACDKTKSLCTEAASITFVEDRDGDIYEQFVRVADDRTHFVIRICKNRRLATGEKLYEKLDALPAYSTYDFEVAGDRRKKRSERIARMQVGFCKVSLKSPYMGKDLAGSFDAYAVQVKETGYEGKDRIIWRLLTTHPIETHEQAIEVVEIYRKRWYIEQLFRLLKKQGFRMEESELETGWALRKLSVLALGATIRIMQIMQATGEEGEQPLSEVFTEREQACLMQTNDRLNKKSPKQRNPYPPKTLIWARWIIARLGGWKGYASQRVPGPITLNHGIFVFNQLYYGWCIALQYFEDVDTQ